MALCNVIILSKFEFPTQEGPNLLGSGLNMEEEEVEEGLVGGRESPVVLPVSPTISSSGSTYSSC